MVVMPNNIYFIMAEKKTLENEKSRKTKKTRGNRRKQEEIKSIKWNLSVA